MLGGINMDLVATAARMPAPGETLIGEEFLTYPGGKGANQAVAAARLGASVKMVGRVGVDTFGPVLLDGLRGEGVDVSGVAQDPERLSGVAIILLDADRQNYIVAVYGANMACDGTQVRAVEQALQGADVLLLQLETPLETSLAAARRAREMGVRVVWDPAPAVALSAEAYSACDVLTPNQVEAEFLVGVSVTDAASAEAATERLLALGANAVIVKRARTARTSPAEMSGFRAGVSGAGEGHGGCRGCLRRGAGGGALPGIHHGGSRTLRLRRRGAGRNPLRRPGGNADQGRGGCPGRCHVESRR